MIILLYLAFPHKTHYPWPHLLRCTFSPNSFLFCLYRLFLLPLLLPLFHPHSLPNVANSLPLTRCLSGAGLYDLSWWLGQRRSPADVRRADRQIQPGGLLSALGLHLGYYGHPGRSHPLLSGIRPWEQAGRTHDRRAAGWEQGWGSIYLYISYYVIW